MARILLIEEEPNAAEIAAVICKEDGHECATVSSVATALDRLQQEPFDLVILDHSPSRELELDFVAALRQKEATRELPLILLTALSDAERRVLERAGVTRALPKPFSIQMLQTLLRQLFKRKPARSEQQVK